MATITQINTYSQTALAAYAQNLAIGNARNISKYKDESVGMADAQATQFDATWAVLEQSAYNINGFSAVLLQNRTTGEKVLAIAGTDPSSPGDLLTDLGIFLGTSVTDILQYNALEAFYTKLTQSGGKLGSSEQFTITGHSLGGFLAQAFTARHASVVSAAYTFNAPGLGAIDNPLGYLGATDAGAGAEKITNVHATDGLSVTAGFGFMLGSTLPVRIENNGITDNHSIVRLSDTLAIYETYARLMPDISTAQASALFAASGSSSRRQEDALDALRTVFTGSASNTACNWLQRALRLLALWMMSLGALNACAVATGGMGGGDSWQEEVLLHDGQKIIVERSQTYKGRSEPGRPAPIGEHTIRFSLPGSSKSITWTSEYGDDLGRTNFNLLALHVKNNTPYVVAEPNLCLAYNKWGRPNPPYVVFRYDGAVWQRIAFDALPPEFTTVNVVKRIRGIDVENLVKAKQIGAGQVAALNAGLERPEAKAIVREAISAGSGLTSCEELIRYKCGWGAPSEFNRKYFENTCN